jgi:glutathione S-transferase
MPIELISFEDAKKAKGLRMTVVPGIPSPWSEAAKGLFHIKRLPWKAVRLDAQNDAMAEWAKERSAPVAFYDDEEPRGRWDQILLLAERLAPSSAGRSSGVPTLLPADPLERARAFGLAHEICGEDGLVWVRRLQGVHSGLTGQAGGFPNGVAQYLAGKYGYRAEAGASYGGRVVELLGLLSGVLHAQRKAGSRFYLGKSLTAVDVYGATAMAMFKPLPPELCPMMELIRPTLEAMDEATAKALDPILLEHRDFIYREYLELPLTL